MNWNHAQTVVLALCLACGSAGTGNSTQAVVEPCNESRSDILGDWARPEVSYVDAEGNVGDAPDWQAELWLPDDPYEDGCRFSCASKYLSAVAIADGPATFVRLTHSTPAPTLRIGSAVLSVSGLSTLSQTQMRTDRFEPFLAGEYFESHLLAFPPTNPPVWDYLETTIEVAGSANRLRVRFVRSEGTPSTEDK